MNDVQHEDNGTEGRFFMKEADEVIAEIIYNYSNNKTIIISHTEVSPKLKGQGIGNKLIDKVVDWARSKNLKINPLCPFANRVMNKGENYKDVLL